MKKGKTGKVLLLTQPKHQRMIPLPSLQLIGYFPSFLPIQTESKPQLKFTFGVYLNSEGKSLWILNQFQVRSHLSSNLFPTTTGHQLKGKPKMILVCSFSLMSLICGFHSEILMVSPLNCRSASFHPKLCFLFFQWDK